MREFNDLVPFSQVVRSGSFSGAARTLGVTTTAVSKSVARLEQRLDVRLLNRTTRSVHLTAEGEQFYALVQAGLSRLDAAMHLMRDVHERPSGAVRVTAATFFGKHFLLPMLPEFLERYPAVEMQLSIQDARPDLVADGFDVGIWLGAPSATTYVARRLYRLPLVLVASPEYLARKGVPRYPADLGAHECIIAPGAARAPATWNFKHASEPRSCVEHLPHGRLTVYEQLDTVVDAAALGLGITVAFVQSVLDHIRSGRLTVLLPDYDVLARDERDCDICLHYPHRDHLPLRMRALVDFLAEHFQAMERIDYSPRALQRMGRSGAREAPRRLPGLAQVAQLSGR